MNELESVEAYEAFVYAIQDPPCSPVSSSLKDFIYATEALVFKIAAVHRDSFHFMGIRTTRMLYRIMVSICSSVGIAAAERLSEK